MGSHETRTFKSGNSVALRLPKGLAIGPNERMLVERHGDILTARRLPNDVEEAERLARFRLAMADLARLGPVGEVQQREPIEFPERPGL
jgi:antitoxin VapB